jgi:invasion protein IalB
MNLVDCAKTGCRAILPANADILAELKGGKAVNAIVVDSKSGKTLVLTGTLNGFKSAAEKQGI